MHPLNPLLFYEFEKRDFFFLIFLFNVWQIILSLCYVREKMRNFSVIKRYFWYVRGYRT